MAKLNIESPKYTTVAEWRVACMTVEMREYLEKCDAEVADDIPTAMTARVDELLQTRKLSGGTKLGAP